MIIGKEQKGKRGERQGKRMDVEYTGAPSHVVPRAISVENVRAF